MQILSGFLDILFFFIHITALTCPAGFESQRQRFCLGMRFSEGQSFRSFWEEGNEIALLGNAGGVVCAASGFVLVFY